MAKRDVNILYGPVRFDHVNYGVIIIGPYDFRTPEEKHIDALMEEHHDFGEHPYGGPQKECPECQREEEANGQSEKVEAERQEKADAQTGVLG